MAGKQDERRATTDLKGLTLLSDFLSCQNWIGLSDSCLGRTGFSRSIHHCNAWFYESAGQIRRSKKVKFFIIMKGKTWCFNKSTFRSPILVPGGFGCNGRFRISSVEHSVSSRELRRPSSSTFSRAFSICLSSAAFCNDSCSFLAVSCWVS